MERQVCYFQIVSAEGFTPSACVGCVLLGDKEMNTGLKPVLLRQNCLVCPILLLIRLSLNLWRGLRCIRQSNRAHMRFRMRPHVGEARGILDARDLSGIGIRPAPAFLEFNRLIIEQQVDWNGGQQ
jgi:hypothetical protein